MQISRQPTSLAPTSGIVTSTNNPPAITPSAIVALGLIMVGVGQMVASYNRRDTHASVYTPQTNPKTPILQPSEVGELWDKYGRFYTSTQIKHNPLDHSEAKAEKDLRDYRARDRQSNQTTYRPMTYAEITRNHSGYAPFIPSTLDQRGRFERTWNEEGRVWFEWGTFPEQMQLKLCFTWNLIQCFMSDFEKNPIIQNLPENERPHAMDRAREYVFCKLYAQHTNQSARIKVESTEHPEWINITHQLSLAICEAHQISDTVLFYDESSILGRRSTCPEDCEAAIRIERELFLNSFRKQEKKEKIGNIVSSIYLLCVSSVFFFCILPGARSSQIKTSESISPNLATPSPPTPPLATENKSMIQRLLRR